MAFDPLALLLATTDDERAAACGQTLAEYQAQLEADRVATEIARAALARENAAHARKCERLNAEAAARDRAWRRSFQYPHNRI